MCCCDCLLVAALRADLDAADGAPAPRPAASRDAARETATGLPASLVPVSLVPARVPARLCGWLMLVLRQRAPYLTAPVQSA
jgi:hypothetical protein